jgi:signal transduction histidine kinase
MHTTVLPAGGHPRFAYWLAIAVPVIGFLVSSAATALFDREIDLAITYLAVFLVALYGGMAPGLVALVVSFALELIGEASLAHATADVPGVDPWRLGVVVVGGVLASLAAGIAQESRWRAEQARRDETAARVEADRSAARSVALAEQSAESRLRADDSRRRLDLLADAGRILGSSLDYASTLPALARLTVPVLGDLCLVEVIGEEEPHSGAVSPSLGELTIDEINALQPSRDATLGPRLAAGETEVRSLDGKASGDGDVLQGLRNAGMQSVMAVPVRLREVTIGTFLFASTDPNREYGETDISTAEVVAQRAAKAIDNGRLHREIQRLATHEQERAAELESIVRTIGEGIVVCGENGDTRVVNQAARRMLGGPISDAAELRVRLGEHGESLPGPGAAFGPAEFHVLDRPTAWIELTAYPVQTADTEYGDAASTSATVYVLRDVTAFRQGQNLREAFLGLLSHELRTPVTTIYAAANVLARPGSSLDADTRQDILRDMVAESNRLYRLVEDLMVLARFDERIELVRDPSLVQHLIPAVLESERMRWPQVTFVFDEPPAVPAVSGDDTSIQQVLRNLLSNAAKYSPLGSTVTVTANEERGGVAVRVLDEGPGIEPTEVEELFDPFYRSPTTSAMASGAGIGLYVSRRLIDAMGGRIWALRREERGSEFGFWLPQFVAPQEEPPLRDVPIEVGAAVDAPRFETPRLGA